MVEGQEEESLAITSDACFYLESQEIALSGG